MPTLMTASAPVRQPGRSTNDCPTETAITLSFGGVDFRLHPSDNNGEVLYKNVNKAADGIMLSLKSFTGTLFVTNTFGKMSFPEGQAVESACAATTTNVSTTVATKLVEEEPDSPEAVGKAHKVSPGQQKLAFMTVTTSEKTSKKQQKPKPLKDRKRVASSSNEDDTEGSNTNDITRKITTWKRTRVEDTSSSNKSRTINNQGKENETNNNMTMLMCQQASQPTQMDVPDMSQTIDTTAFGSESGTTNSKESYSTTGPFIAIDDESSNKKNTSVQDILDQVNSTGDSIMGDDREDDDDDESATHVEEKDNEMNIVVQSTNDNGKRMDDSANCPANEELKGYPPPAARWGHSLTPLQNGNILVYGGQSYDLEGNPVILADVHLYDVKKSSWDKPINCRGEARQFHSATYIPERNYIIAFGGETLDVVGKSKNKNKIVTSDTLRVLDTEIMLWYPPAVSGDIPTGRSGHTATFFPDTNELVLFGGVRGSKWLNAVNVLDVTRWHWTSPKIEGMPPKPRSYHSATAVGKNKLVIFGGNNKTSCFNSVHVLEAIVSTNNRDGDNSSDVPPSCTWKWSNPTVKGKAPFSRTGHTATLLDDGKTICIYGGWDPNDDDEDNIFKGSYLLDTKEWTWAEGPKAEPLGSGSPNHVVDDCGPKRCGHQAVFDSEKGEVLVFGGRIPGEALAGDMQRLVPPKEKAVRLEG